MRHTMMMVLGLVLLSATGCGHADAQPTPEASAYSPASIRSAPDQANRRRDRTRHADAR